LASQQLMRTEHRTLLVDTITLLEVQYTGHRTQAQ